MLAQTEGEEPKPLTIPEWDAEQLLINLSIERLAFDLTDGNVKGFTRGRQLAINPLVQRAHKLSAQDRSRCFRAHLRVENLPTPKRHCATFEMLKQSP